MTPEGMFFKAVIFDLDGTLIDSAPQVRASVNKVLAGHGHRVVTDDEIIPLLGRGARYTIEGAFAAVDGEKTALEIDRCLEDYLNHYLDDPTSRTVIYPGVIEVLEKFHAAGMVMGVCTNKPSTTASLVLEELGLMRFFAAVVAADDVANPKPAAGHLFETLAAMGADAVHAVMVGDSESDIAAARGARIASVAVTYGYCKSDPAGLGADVLIDRFDLLPGVLADGTIFERDAATS